MNISREDLPGRQVALTIELDTETVNTALDRAYRQMVNQVNIPGFRRGKAPRYMVERYMGAEALTERAVRNILPQTVQDAITEQNIDAMDVGEVEIINMEPVTVKVIIVQPPTVELSDYSDIRVAKEQEEIDPEKLDKVIAELQRDGAPWNAPEEPRPIKEGDMVYVDLEAFTGQGELEAAKREDFPTIVGMQGAGIPDAVNAALVGMSVGEEKDVIDPLPEDYPVEDLRGLDASYHVTVRSMKEQQLPEVTDEWAKSLGFDSVDALKEAVDRNLKQRSEETAESNQVNQIISQLIERATVDVPEVMVNEELDTMLKNIENRLKEQRVTLRQYFTYNGVSEGDWREANREQARERVVRGLALQEFARREGISVEDDELQSEIDQMVENFGGEEKDRARSVLEQSSSRSDLQDRLFNRKLVDRMVGIAEGTITAAPAPEGTAAAEGEGEAAPAEEQAAAEPAKAPRKSRKSQAAAASAETEAETSGDESSASDIENAAGAAELLNADEPKSPNETGEAEGGGTPDTAPALDESSEK